jgi:hypothetical protein
MITIDAKRCASRYWYVTVRSDEIDTAIVGFGDLHRGTPSFDEGMAREVRDWIVGHNCVWLGMGDYLEMGTKHSIGASVFDQVEKPEHQMLWIKEFFKPIRGKCVGLLKGNHEERAHKDTGLDPVQTISEFLEVPYLMWEAFGSIVRTDTGKTMAVSFYGCHHYAGHKSMGLLEAWAAREIKVNADIVLLGHSHDKGAIPTSIIDIDMHSRSVTERKQMIVGTGHFLGRPDSYIASRGTRPKPKGTYAVWSKITSRGKSLRAIELPEE